MEAQYDVELKLYVSIMWPYVAVSSTAIPVGTGYAIGYTGTQRTG
jgi:hypothetical protein